MSNIVGHWRSDLADDERENNRDKNRISALGAKPLETPPKNLHLHRLFFVAGSGLVRAFLPLDLDPGLMDVWGSDNMTITPVKRHRRSGSFERWFTVREW
ncbi:hypothetical protein PanWU01x14_295190 [Parasponia andersonii]|uniref:Uncharacterized protein n=1 Tax=Parasponia andersonii TaxID=3476 RepID=A0A2P5AW10_PARAD|nr:hypothetical protein PanWU01x14_295190 [Parasponia andersonii]